MAQSADILSRRNLIIVGAGIVLAVCLFAGIKLYDLGYRLSFSQGFTRPASLVISPFTQGTELYVNGKRILEAGIAGEAVNMVIPAGLHEITLSRKSYFPWQKQLDVESGERIVVGPFNIPETTNGAVLAPTDAEYPSARALLADAAAVPTEERPVRSRDGIMSAFVRGQSLIARVESGTPPQYFCSASCEPEKEVVALQAEVRGLAFLPGRNDVLLMAVQDGVFAIELDTRGTQNFQVLYRGIRPTFAVSPEGLVYIREENTIFKVFLFPSNQ